MSYFSFDAEVLFAFFAFGDTFFTLGLMVHIGLGSDRRRLAGFSGRFSRSLTSRLRQNSVKMSTSGDVIKISANFRENLIYKLYPEMN